VHILLPGMKPFSMFLASCWLPKMDITPKAAGILRQRYAESKVALKSIQEGPSKDSVIWVWHVDNVESDVFGARVFGSAKGHRECDSPDWFDSFPIEALEGLRQFSVLLSVKPILLIVARKRILAWLPFSIRILVTFHLSMWNV
jgi:hypothetical protein